MKNAAQMSEIFNYCNVVGRTDIGRKRSANEDSMDNAVTINGLVSVVCDGMGGHVGGATASRTAVTSIMENLKNVYYDDPRIAIGESIDIANRAILEKANNHPELQGMGSTCVLLLVRDGKVYVGHVGDSRIYLVRSRRIAQLTKDHSYVQMLVDSGEITKEQAERHPRKNEITNALGIPNMAPATVAESPIIPEAGDCFVLCSDGLSGMVPDDIICKVVSKQSELSAQDRVDTLVDMANANGGLDNITVQLVEFAVSPASVEANSFKMKPWMWICATLCLCCVVAGGVTLVHYLLTKDKTEIIEDGITKQRISLPEIPFEKNARVLEFEYGEDYIKVNRNGTELYSEQTAFDQNSLTVSCPEFIKLEFNNLLLSFTETCPLTEIVISVRTADKTRQIDFVVPVADNKPDALKPGADLPFKKVITDKPEKKIDEPVPAEEKAKLDTIGITFNCRELSEGAKLLLNYFGNRPEIRLDGLSKKVGTSIESIDSWEYGDLYWDVENNKVNRQLIFKFKGGASKSVHSFEITFVDKKSKKKMVLAVKLVPEPEPTTESKPELKPESKPESKPELDKPAVTSPVHPDTLTKPGTDTLASSSPTDTSATGGHR